MALQNSINWDDLRKRMLMYKFTPGYGGFSVNAGSDVIKCASSITTLSAVVTGGHGPFTYVWSPSTGLGSTTIASPTASHTSTVTYSVIVTDSEGNTCTDSVVVAVPISITIGYTQIDVTCFGLTNGSVALSPSNGIGPYTYLWSDSSTASTISGLGAGTVSVIVTDSCGLTAGSQFVITQPTAISVSIVSQNADCPGGAGSATASATGGTSPYTYSWNSGASTAHATGLTAGTWVVTVTDSVGCSKTSSVSITAPASYTLSVAVTGSQSITSGSVGGYSASVYNGSSPYTYLWSPGGSTSSSGTASFTQSVVYTVVVTDSCGMTGSATGSVTLAPSVDGYTALLLHFDN